MIILCQEVVVKFRDSVRQNTQLITIGDGPTATRVLRVHDYVTRIVIEFLNDRGDVRKYIAYPIEVIMEYSCDRVESIAVNSTPGQSEKQY